ncbi:hypothetical protein AB6D30_20840 [Pectobacterium brasiliense]|uniref:hypothetical protein n=1 Tax=Pectobacterium brasiliense TaxID=180957 RepID=UPI001D0D6B28|nr:hypothetical protein [Pectobacterium brasiliense]MDY4336122.1 hypothetical protein [Pectobacterium brasiliense]UDQ74097.1 hypothetical protein LJQ72_10840 [Pectobacterium brasiliense]
MTDTAFSKSLQMEVDPEQYMALKNLDGGSVHAVAREDILCPICKVGGGSFVKASQSEGYNKKSHFRFAGDNGEGHHPSCDFYGDRLSSEVKLHLVQFTKDRTKYSQLIRKLVCAGIQENIFTQEKMWQMREWFFKKRKDSTLEIWLDEEHLDWLEYITSLRDSYRAWTNPDILPFSPIQVTVPGFSWSRAIDREALIVHLETLQKLREISVSNRDISAILEHLRNNRSRTILDPTLLEDEINKTKKLTDFVMCNYQEFQTKTVRDRAYGEAKFLAFAALLLFVSDWNIDTAIGKFSKIVRIKEVDDMLAGNFIGLNPYFHYDVARTVKKLQDNWPIKYNELEHWNIEKSMRETYERWHSTEPEFAPPLLPDLYVSIHQKEAKREAEIKGWIENGDY